MTQPFFSIIITTYNRPQKIIRAIKSVIRQTFTNFELIIVNDGSTKDYSEVENYINNYPQSIKYHYKKNEERSTARNFGVKQASGEFVCFLDDDDYYLENHLAVLFCEIEKRNHEHALYHTYSKKLNSDNTWTKYEIIPKPKNLTEQEYYLSGGIMTMNCSCFARKILIEFPFDPILKMAEDSNQRLRALSKYRIYRIPAYTSVYDFSESSTRQHSINLIFQYLETWKKTFEDPTVKHFVSKKSKTESI